MNDPPEVCLIGDAVGPAERQHTVERLEWKRWRLRAERAPRIDPQTCGDQRAPPRSLSESSKLCWMTNSRGWRTKPPVTIDATPDHRT